MAIPDLILDTAENGKLLHYDIRRQAIRRLRSSAELSCAGAYKSGACVGIVGHLANAELILDVAENTDRLYLLGPNLGECDMRQAATCRRAPSVGGWRPFTPVDKLTFEICLSLDAGASVLSPMVKRHPAWIPLSFLNVSTNDAAWIISQSRDPRWLEDPKSPGSGAFMTNYYGLNWPMIFSRIAQWQEGGSSGCVSPWDFRAHRVLDIFCKDLESRLTNPTPEDFLAKLVSGVSPARSSSPASVFCVVVLRAIQFVHLAWVDLINSATYNMSYSAGSPPQLFVPTLFFDDDEVCSKWSEHCCGAA